MMSGRTSAGRLSGILHGEVITQNGEALGKALGHFGNASDADDPEGGSYRYGAELPC